MTSQPSVRFGTLLLLSAGLAAVLAAFGDRFVSNWAYALERGKLQATADELQTVQDLSRAFRGVAKLARPGVVQIRVSGGTAEALDPTMLEELRRRLNLDEEELQQWLRRHGRMTRSSGSGVLFDKDGYILTNNHVVGGRREIRVRLHDDREFDAALVGTDPKTDLAVIRIEAPNLPALPFGDSDAVEVGDFVLAIGAPFGLGQTVTHGIISAKGRNDISDLPIAYQDFLQTDAAINPGNSGGPLVNLKGEVVGINTAIATAGVGENAGVAFVIPANRALRVARQLKTGGEVARGWLGVQMGDITREDADVLGIGVESLRGVVVEGVLLNTPAAEAGLAPEDVIVRLNGAAFDGRNQLRNQIADMLPGETIQLDVLRDGKPKPIRVTLGKQPERMGAGPDTIVGRAIEKLGVEALSLRPEQATRLGYDPDTRGVVVVRNADEKLLGVRSGEVIVSFNGERVASVADLTRELLKAKSNTYRLQVLAPDGERRTVILERE